MNNQATWDKLQAENARLLEIAKELVRRFDLLHDGDWQEDAKWIMELE